VDVLVAKQILLLSPGRVQDDGECNKGLTTGYAVGYAAVHALSCFHMAKNSSNLHACSAGGP